ncbi:DUF3160 domain-containing protein [Desulfonatronum thiodismutans]|uniref:DUF3160 domain-containing protein n=1 Tax=Desulfonatronum thiodismutans TaxID=159290 RepID=UPI0004ABE849|nr:DUF3160 domain-containing protein [Desulfonatronum thiodismutans]
MSDTTSGHPFYPLKDRTASMLHANGFAVVPGAALQSMEEVYATLRTENIPILATTDSILHFTHRIFDQLLHLVETDQVIGDLKELTGIMLRRSIQNYEAAENDKIRQALRSNVLFFSVAARLLGLRPAVPSELVPALESLVEQEIELILAGRGFAPSPVLGYLEDYSQYAPRGRYTQSKALRSYFLAMTWYGRIGFYVGPIGSLRVTDDLARRLTRQALLMVRALHQPDAETDPGLAAWERINAAIVLLIGPADDLDVHDYRKAAVTVFGGLPDDDDLADDSRLETYMEEIRRGRPPGILSTLGLDAEQEPNRGPGRVRALRFLGQRFTPDAWILQQLVYPRVMDYTGASRPFTLVMSQRGPIRGLPRGLDVMAALGSDLAARIIRAEGDGDYVGFDEQLRMLQNAFSRQGSGWPFALYWDRLRCVTPLLGPVPGNAPGFMQSEAWAKKSLNTALGAWAELRHDSILYAKQSYTEMGTGRPRPVERTFSHVEPYPEFYARVRALVDKVRTNSARHGAISREVHGKLDEFAGLLAVLTAAAEKELAGEALSPDEYETIWMIGSLLESAASFPAPEAEYESSRAANGAAVVADVHTDPNSGQVLQVGVGRPFVMYVSMVRDGRERIAAGPVYSYYEFKQPMAGRLTNEQWREMLQRDQVPPLQNWSASFVAQKATSSPR